MVTHCESPFGAHPIGTPVYGRDATRILSRAPCAPIAVG